MMDYDYDHLHRWDLPALPPWRLEATDRWPAIAAAIFAGAFVVAGTVLAIFATAWALGWIAEPARRVVASF